MKSVEFKKYEEYQDSGVEWLGETPKEWGILKGNYIFEIINERSKDGKEELLSVSEHYGVRKRSDLNVNMFMAESYKGYKLCQPNDLVINSLWAWSRGLGFSKYHGIVSTAYSVFRLKNKNYSSQYLNYLLRTKKYVSQYLILSKGIWISRLQLSDWNFLRIPILSPPLEEQIAIANFLDEKCNKIDKAIAQKEKLIELLNERKQVIIQNSVTKGLNPEVEMKESEIGWIGKIPKQWEVTRLGTRFIERRRKVSDKDFSPLSVTKNGVVPQLETAVKTNDGDNRKLVKKGDFVINSRSDRKGSSGIAKKDGSVSLINIVLKPREIYPEFCNYLLKCNSFKEEFYRMGHGIVADLWTTRYDEMKNIKIMIPNFCEQISIVNFIEKECQKIDNAIVLQEKQLQKLKEYRAILIDNAVTGKIKVGD